MKSKKFITDVLLNIIAVALPLFVLQLVSLPIVADRVGGEKYGVIIALISAMTVIAFPMGNVLNNTRLLRNDWYVKKGVSGDFNVLLSSGAVIAAIAMAIATWIIDIQSDVGAVLLLMMVVIASAAKDYLVVGFRLNLNFKNVLFNNVWLAVGYLIGTGFFSLLGYWQLIYLTGLLFSLLFILRHLSLHKEPYRITSEFRTTMIKIGQLYIAGLLRTLINYADKLLLLPILGPVSVAVYYSATIIGKMISMIINPINSVLLSYLVKVEHLSIRDFLKILGVLSVVAISGYFITVWISPYFFAMFYPNWAEGSMEIVHVTTATAVITMMSSIIQPFNLRFNDTKWQIYMGGLYMIAYLALGVSLGHEFGLTGFSWGILVAAVFNLLLQITVFTFNARNTKRTS